MSVAGVNLNPCTQVERLTGTGSDNPNVPPDWNREKTVDEVRWSRQEPKIGNGVVMEVS